MSVISYLVDIRRRNPSDLIESIQEYRFKPTTREKIYTAIYRIYDYFRVVFTDVLTIPCCILKLFSDDAFTVYSAESNVYKITEELQNGNDNHHILHPLTRHDVCTVLALNSVRFVYFTAPQQGDLLFSKSIHIDIIR